MRISIGVCRAGGLADRILSMVHSGHAQGRIHRPPSHAGPSPTGSWRGVSHSRNRLRIDLRELNPNHQFTDGAARCRPTPGRSALGGPQPCAGVHPISIALGANHVLVPAATFVVTAGLLGGLLVRSPGHALCARRSRRGSIPCGHPGDVSIPSALCFLVVVTNPRHGVSIVHDILEEHDGELSLEVSEWGGAAFCAAAGRLSPLAGAQRIVRPYATVKLSKTCDAFGGRGSSLTWVSAGFEPTGHEVGRSQGCKSEKGDEIAEATGCSSKRSLRAGVG
jgi:hypothetical protein